MMTEKELVEAYQKACSNGFGPSKDIGFDLFKKVNELEAKLAEAEEKLERAQTELRISMRVNSRDAELEAMSKKLAEAEKELASGRELISTLFASVADKDSKLTEAEADSRLHLDGLLNCQKKLTEAEKKKGLDYLKDAILDRNIELENRLAIAVEALENLAKSEQYKSGQSAAAFAREALAKIKGK